MEIQIIEPKPGRLFFISVASHDRLNKLEPELRKVEQFLHKHDMEAIFYAGGSVRIFTLETAGQPQKGAQEATIIAEARKVAKEFKTYIDHQRERRNSVLHFDIESFYGQYLQKLIAACEPLGDSSDE